MTAAGTSAVLAAPLFKYHATGGDLAAVARTTVSAAARVTRGRTLLPNARLVASPPRTHADALLLLRRCDAAKHARMRLISALKRVVSASATVTAPGDGAQPDRALTVLAGALTPTELYYPPRMNPGPPNSLALWRRPPVTSARLGSRPRRAL